MSPGLVERHSGQHSVGKRVSTLTLLLAAGTEKILGQNPYEPPTRRTERSSKPLFHVMSMRAREDLRQEFLAYLARYCEASMALRGGHLKAADWFPEGSYPPALASSASRRSGGHHCLLSGG